MNIGEFLKATRENKKLTLKKLSEKSGVGQSTISDIENGLSQNPRRDTLNKLADALGVHVSEFFNGESHTPKFEKPNLKREPLNIDVPEEFTNPDEARNYIGMHQIFASEGFNVNTMSDEEVINFANALLEQMRLVGYKFKK